MKFTTLKIPGIVLIEPIIYEDERGYFMETFVLKELEEAVGYKIDFVQSNESKSSLGVLRGLHYQISPAAQSKLVRVIEGKIIDVALDIRKSSPTFGKFICIELSSKNKQQLFIPKGFAHGFVSLSEAVVVSYKVDNYYSKTHERGIAFDDKNLGIDWKFNTKDLIISDNDKKYPILENTKDLFE
tara:strand:- start:4 stop:558 length:555 start_codon:yes stop_codon:yes gene_type:complete